MICVCLDLHQMHLLESGDNIKFMDKNVYFAPYSSRTIQTQSTLNRKLMDQVVSCLSYLIHPVMCLFGLHFLKLIFCFCVHVCNQISVQEFFLQNSLPVMAAYKVLLVIPRSITMEADLQCQLICPCTKINTSGPHRLPLNMQD